MSKCRGTKKYPWLQSGMLTDLSKPPGPTWIKNRQYAVQPTGGTSTRASTTTQEAIYIRAEAAVYREVRRAAERYVAGCTLYERAPDMWLESWILLQRQRKHGLRICDAHFKSTNRETLPPHLTAARNEHQTHQSR